MSNRPLEIPLPPTEVERRQQADDHEFALAGESSGIIKNPKKAEWIAHEVNPEVESLLHERSVIACQLEAAQNGLLAAKDTLFTSDDVVKIRVSIASIAHFAQAVEDGRIDNDITSRDINAHFGRAEDVYARQRPRSKFVTYLSDISQRAIKFTQPPLSQFYNEAFQILDNQTEEDRERLVVDRQMRRLGEQVTSEEQLRQMITDYYNSTQDIDDIDPPVLGGILNGANPEWVKSLTDSESPTSLAPEILAYMGAAARSCSDWTIGGISRITFLDDFARFGQSPGPRQREVVTLGQIASSPNELRTILEKYFIAFDDPEGGSGLGSWSLVQSARENGESWSKALEVTDDGGYVGGWGASTEQEIAHYRQTGFFTEELLQHMVEEKHRFNLALDREFQERSKDKEL